MIAFRCQSCGATLRVKDDRGGRKGKCPACGEPIHVPNVPTATSGPAQDEGVIAFADSEDDEIRDSGGAPARPGGCFFCQERRAEDDAISVVAMREPPRFGLRDLGALAAGMAFRPPAYVAVKGIERDDEGGYHIRIPRCGRCKLMHDRDWKRYIMPMIWGAGVSSAVMLVFGLTVVPSQGARGALAVLGLYRGIRGCSWRLHRFRCSRVANPQEADARPSAEGASCGATHARGRLEHRRHQVK